MSTAHPTMAWTQRFDEPDVDVAGITKLELTCCTQTKDIVQQLARRWGEDRALSAGAVSRLVSVVRAAVELGRRFDPRGATVSLRWLDLDRVRIDVRWHGGRAPDRGATADSDVESAAATLDALAEDWLFAASRPGPVLWMVIDTR